MSTDFPSPQKLNDNRAQAWLSEPEEVASGVAAPDEDGLISRMAKENLHQMRQSLRSAFLSPPEKSSTTLTSLTIFEADAEGESRAAASTAIEAPAYKGETKKDAPSENKVDGKPQILDVPALTPHLEITEAKASPFENIEKQLHGESASTQLLTSLGLNFGPNSYQTWTWRQDGTRSTAIMNTEGLTRIVSCRPDGKLSDCVKRDGVDLVRFNPNGEVFINAQFNRTA